MKHQSITREDRLAYIDLFEKARNLAIRSPFHILLFDEALSPVLQAFTVDEILHLHPTDAPMDIRLWTSEDVGEILKKKRSLWECRGGCTGSPGRPGTVMLIVPQLDDRGQREAGTWETVYYQEQGQY